MDGTLSALGSAWVPEGQPMQPHTTDFAWIFTSSASRWLLLASVDLAGLPGDAHNGACSQAAPGTCQRRYFVIQSKCEKGSEAMHAQQINNFSVKVLVV